jgi:FkbM family methyltransferase
MSIISSIRFIINHPLNRNNKSKAISRFIKWQINNILNPFSIIYPFTEKSKLIIKKGMTGATGNLYYGLHEYQDMFFLLHFLRPSDLFVDIGANIGSYTVLAAAHVEADTISIEPVPSTFTHLTNNLKINDIQKKVIALNMALGSKKGYINFTKNQDTTNHVAISGEKDIITVDVSTLDIILTTDILPPP